jgi:hypothetical protein
MDARAFVSKIGAAYYFGAAYYYGQGFEVLIEYRSGGSE